MMDTLELASWKLVNIICWDKGHFGTGAGYRSQSEYILVFSKGLPNTFNLRNVANVIKAKRENKLHPHQKPLELIEIFVKNSTKEGDTILDPFIGCGTTALASRRNNRKYIGYELSKEYVEIANQQLNQCVLGKVNEHDKN